MIAQSMDRRELSPNRVWTSLKPGSRCQRVKRRLLLDWKSAWLENEGLPAWAGGLEGSRRWINQKCGEYEWENLLQH